MRLLLDEHGLTWDAAWTITRQAVSYTNHTLMPEALETWPVRMFEALLPRHLEIIYEINHRFLNEVKARFPGDEALLRRVSLIDEGGNLGGERRVRMAALSIVASHRVNGVAALHSELMVQTIFADYAAHLPGALPQRHQRRDAAPLAAAGQPEPVDPDRRSHRQGLAQGPGRAEPAQAPGGRRRLRPAVPGRQARPTSRVWPP